MTPESTPSIAPAPAAPDPSPGGRASEGHSLGEIHYREYKIILRPDRFTGPQSFSEFAKLTRHVAKELDVALFRDEIGENHLREVVFYDTASCDLYNHAFILRRRTPVRNGWPEEGSELVLKFRHVDQATAAAVDMRARWTGSSRVKFKEELLSLRAELGGMRSLFSHGCALVIPRSLPGGRLGDIVQFFPALEALGLPADTALGVVAGLHVEEILADIGALSFGHGVQATANVALWRDRGPGTALVGEFAYQIKFEHADELHKKARHRADEFFRHLQLGVRDWVKLAITKTGVVYGTGAAPVTNRE